MTSKKNRNLTRNLADEKQRFGIRKFSVGVASVLLGTSLMFGANTQIAHADSENGGIIVAPKLLVRFSLRVKMMQQILLMFKMKQKQQKIK